MLGWTWVMRRIGVLFNKGAEESELDEEIRFHLEMEIREYLRQGLSAGEARRRALVDFGGIERFKEEVRDVRGARVVDDLAQDTRVALRSLPKQPAFLFAVLLTLGIGIGGNVAMFGVLDRSIRSALPYPDAQELILGRVTRDGDIGWTVSAPDFLDYRAESESFQAMGAITPFAVEATITGEGGAERVGAPHASVGFFETLGVMPEIGRYFLPEEGETSGAAVTVLSYGYWQRRFGGDSDILGKTISIDGRPHTVVGVAQAGFRFLLDAELWVPMRRNVGMAGSRSAHNFTIVGRLASGVNSTAAQSEVDAISSQLELLYPDSNTGKGLAITPLREALSERYLPAMGILMATVVVLLLIACANVAGLLLARGSARRSEMALRSVMGAGRGRLARQLLTENLYLAIGAGLVGLLLALWIQRGVLAFMPMDQLGEIAPGLSLKTLGFALFLSVGTVLLFGLAPSLRMARTEPAVDLKAGGRGRSGSRGARFRSGLVVVQVAMTVVLLAVSGLLLRSFQQLMQVEAGFDTEHLVTASISIPRAEYPTPESRAAFFEALADRLVQIPGVSSAALASHLPVQDPGNNYGVSKPEDFRVEGAAGRFAYQRSVVPGYLKAMGIPLLRGRSIDRTDDATSTDVVVLSEALSHYLFGEEDPLGRTIAVDHFGDEPNIREVIGVAGDVVVGSPGGGSELAMYYPYDQRAMTGMRIALRAQGELTGVVTSVREAVRSLDPQVPISRVATMEEAISRSVAGERAMAVVLVLFAAIALLLTGVGLYGVLAYQVSQRLPEIGVRMALGASAATVTQGVVTNGLKLIVVGLLIGIPGAWFAGHLVRGMLYGIEPNDPATLLGVAAFLSVVGVTACLLPARRAARVNPVEAFRAE